METPWIERILIGILFSVVLTLIGFSVWVEVKHPCVRWNKEITHHESTNAGTTLWIATGNVGYIALDHEAYDSTEDVCVERK
jgi:hypothetical protein